MARAERCQAVLCVRVRIFPKMCVRMCSDVQNGWAGLCAKSYVNNCLPIVREW